LTCQIQALKKKRHSAHRDSEQCLSQEPHRKCPHYVLIFFSKSTTKTTTSRPHRKSIGGKKNQSNLIQLGKVSLSEKNMIMYFVVVVVVFVGFLFHLSTSVSSASPDKTKIKGGNCSPADTMPCKTCMQQHPRAMQGVDV
jgi:hypothetical protein